jgi:hypothetical protein
MPVRARTFNTAGAFFSKVSAPMEWIPALAGLQ